MQTIDGPLSCSECGFLCSKSDDTGTFVDRLTAVKRSPAGNYNRTYHYIRKAYPLWQQLYHQLSLDHNVALRSQCDNSLEGYRQKAFIDAPRLLGEAYNFPENGESEGWLHGQQLRNRRSGSNRGFDDPELPRLFENAAVPYSVLHGAINEIASPTGASSRGPVTTTTTTHLVFSVTKGNVKTAKKGKLFKSVLWFAVGVKRSTNKKKANLKTRRYKVRREIVYHGKLISSVTTFKKLRNRPHNSNKMDNLRAWPTLSGGATTSNFPSPFYQRSFPSPGSGCDWASVVKQRYFESSADHKSSMSAFKRAEETSSLQLKASLVVTKTKRVPEKNHALNSKSAAKPLVRTDDKDGYGKSAKNGASDSFRAATKQVSEYAENVTAKAAAAAESSGGTCLEVNSNADRSRIFSEDEMPLLKTLCSSAPANAVVCEENGGDLSSDRYGDGQLVQSNRGGEETQPQDAGVNATCLVTLSCGQDDGKLFVEELNAPPDKVAIAERKSTDGVLKKTTFDIGAPYRRDEDASGLHVNVVRVKQSGITATVTENSLDIDAEIAGGASSTKILHLTAKNILNTKTDLSIFSESKSVAQNFRTQLLKVKSRKGSSDEGWRREGKNHAALRLCDESLGQNQDGNKVVVICKISNESESPAMEKTEAAAHPRLVDIEAASVDGSGEKRLWNGSDEQRRAAERESATDETSPVVVRDDSDARKRCDGDKDAEAASGKNAAHFTGHKNQTKQLRSKMKYDAAATAFIPVTNWKRKPHASPSLSKYRWIAPPRKDSQLSPRTSLSKFQQNKQASGNQSADYRKISKKVDAAAFVGRKMSVVEASAKGNVFAGRGRGSLIKSATFTNSNLDAVDRSYVMSDGMKVVFGPNAVNTPCSKGGGKTVLVAAGKEKSAAKKPADEFRPMKPPSRLSEDSYRKDAAKNPFQQPYHKSNSWKNAVLRVDNERMPPPLYADMMYRLPVDHGLKAKWVQPPHPAYEENPDVEDKVRYVAPPLFGAESSFMVQQGSAFCPGVKLCQGRDKLMDAAWRSHQVLGVPPWADNYQQQHPAAIQPVFFIPRKETAARNHCGEIQNNNMYAYFCRGSHFVGAFGDQEKQ